MFLAEDGRPLSLKWTYTRGEIVADGAIHFIGIALGAAGAAALVVIAALNHLGWVESLALAVYAAALVSMFGVSAAYNLWPVGPRKWFLRRFDHALIYFMIAGTYTPIVALLGNGAVAWTMLALVWSTAAIGIAVKLLLPGRFDRLAIGLYLALGWSGFLTVELALNAMTPTAMWLLAAGGLIYSLGVVFHVWRSLPFQNAIWHAFVLTGAALHYFSIMTSVIAASS